MFKKVMDRSGVRSACHKVSDRRNDQHNIWEVELPNMKKLIGSE